MFVAYLIILYTTLSIFLKKAKRNNRNFYTRYNDHNQIRTKYSAVKKDPSLSTSMRDVQLRWHATQTF